MYSWDFVCLPGPPDPAPRVALSNDGGCYLASCLSDTGGKLYLVEKVSLTPKTGLPACLLKGICSLFVFRDVAQASGEVLNTYTGHVNESFHVGSCFTNTDAFVASGGENGLITFWGLVDVRATDVNHFLR